MWTQVSADDSGGLNRHMGIMRQMAHSYAMMPSAVLVAAIRKQQGELWHYQGQGFEIGILFQYSLEREHWQVLHVGFVGNVQPAAALDLTVSRIRDFLQGHNTPSFFTVPVTTADYQPLRAFYDLCLTNPDLRVRLVAQGDVGSVWEVSYIGP